MKYKAFTRTWWKENIDWPNGLEPSAGKKRTIGTFATEIEAMKCCKDYNRAHKAGRLSRKAEFTEI